MSEYALDNPIKETHASSVANGVTMSDNVIQLCIHPLWLQRELERLLSYIDGKPDSGWNSIFSYYGEEHAARGKEWTVGMVHSGAFSNEKILDLAKTVAPFVLFLERREERRKTSTFSVEKILG